MLSCKSILKERKCHEDDADRSAGEHLYVRLRYAAFFMVRLPGRIRRPRTGKFFSGHPHRVALFS